MKVNEMRGNQFLPGNCIYRPENYPEDWRERLEAGEAISYEEDGKQCQIWLEEEEEEEYKALGNYPGAFNMLICGGVTTFEGLTAPPPKLLRY